MNWPRRLVSPKEHVSRCPQPSIWDRVASEKWHRFLHTAQGREVRDGSKSEVAALERHVCFNLMSRHRQAVPACPFRAKNGRCLLSLRCGAVYISEATGPP
jgi:hypothetical protein